MTTPLEFTKKTIPEGPQSGRASPVVNAPASALSLLIDKNKDRFSQSPAPEPLGEETSPNTSPANSASGPGGDSSANGSAANSLAGSLHAAHLYEDENQGFVDGAGEIGNISIPRYGSSASIATPAHRSLSNRSSSSASVEARFIVNVPRTPSTTNVAGSSSSFLARSLSKVSLSSRRANRASSVASVRDLNNVSGSFRPNSGSSSSNLRRLVGGSDSSPSGSVDSSVSGFPANGNGASSAGSIHSPRVSSIKSYGKLGKTLGEGAGGHVKIVKSSNGQMYAVKEFRSKHSSESQRDYQKKLGAEYCLGLTLQHPNVISTLDIIHEPERVYHVMEYCEYDLFAIVMSGKMSRNEVYCDFAQIMSGIKYLHDSGIGHRDLKLDNCVINASGIVKIIDFGSAVVYRYPESQRKYDTNGVVGSDPYLAPEASKAGSDRYDPCAADCWSAAIILCCMLMRKFPWRAPKISDASFNTFIKVSDDGVRKGMDNLLNSLPEETHDLMRGLLDLDPVTRWTMDQCWDTDFLNSIEYCTKEPGHVPQNHEHSTVPFEEAHIAMLEKKNRKAKKGEKMW